jgi:hypothetical protein
MNAVLEDLFLLLVAEQVDFAIIGGFGAVVLGVPIVTQDIDLAYNPDSSNIRRLARALEPLHPRLRVLGVPDEEARTWPFRLDERQLRQASIFTLVTDVTDLDLMSSVPGVGDYAAVKAASIEVELFGRRVFVLNLPGIIAAKRTANRPKDLLALPQIEAILRLREQEKKEKE